MIFQTWCQAGYPPDSFWRQTPRTTMLAIWGARHRQDADFRNVVTGAWLGGMLSQCPPAQYPTLEKLIGAEQKPAEPEKIDPQEAAANARAWGAWLRAGQRKRKKRSGKK